LGAALLLAVSGWHHPRLTVNQLTGAQLDAAATAKLSVTDAVKTAEKLMGGEVLEASYAVLPRRAGPAYALRTYRKGALWEAKIDANSGQILGTKAMTPSSTLDAEDRAEVASLKTSGTSIVQAIRIAERQSNGRAVSADLELVGTGVFWEVIVVADGRPRKLLIDPALAKRPAREGILQGAPVTENL
jgi:uncharacterized membrane protein YkoI